MPKCLDINIVLYPRVSKKTSPWKFKQDFEVNANKNLSYQHLEDAAITMPSGRFIALKTCLRREKSLQTNELTIHTMRVGKG